MTWLRRNASFILQEDTTSAYTAVSSKPGHQIISYCADAVGDILRGLLDADFSGISDPVGDILTALNTFADFRSAPDVGGMSSRTRSLSYYFPDLLHPVSTPTGHAPIADFLTNLQVYLPENLPDILLCAHPPQFLDNGLCQWSELSWTSFFLMQKILSGARDTEP